MKAGKKIIEDREDTFNVALKVLKKFKFDFQIEVRNMKEEAKDDNEESGISDNDD